MQITNQPFFNLTDAANWMLQVPGYPKEVQTLTGTNSSLRIFSAQNTSGFILLDAEIRSIGTEFHTQFLNIRNGPDSPGGAGGLSPGYVSYVDSPIAISEVICTSPYFVTKTKLKNPVYVPPNMSLLIASDQRTDPNIPLSAKQSANSAFFRAVSMSGNSLVPPVNRQ